jgi:hypothetical protein
MPAPFKQITLQQFAVLIEKFPFSRKIDAVHMHHTWRPNRSQYKGHDTIVGMWAYHTQHNGWSDIAQHITIAPDGTIWLGRDWNKAPASSSGHNGNSIAGPFMFEMIGDFDQGRDPFDGPQRKTALEVTARVQKRFGLAPGSLVFHNMMSSKTCPGDALSYKDILNELGELHQAMDAGVRDIGEMDGPFAADSLETAQITEEALEDLARPGIMVSEPADADPCAHVHAAEPELEERGESARGSGLSAEQLQALRPYLVNLTMGQFSSEGEWKTSPGDVDAIFEEHLPRALENARRDGQPLRLMFYAHGGLNSESTGLQIAQKSVAWWRANNIYPIYFVWETGAFETIGQLIARARQGAARALPRDIFDFTTDPVIQETVRALQGPRVWGGMKLSAQLASATNTVTNDGSNSSNSEGGACYVARKLGEFCKAHDGQLELHAAGHSAGSIFHSHFIPRALEFGAPSFRSAHLLAPAVRVDLFKQQLGARLGPGKGIDKLTVYTMRKDYEEDDSCATVYRKSLLYLIYHALEPEHKAPILGLEICLRSDPELKRLLGLGAPADGEVVWSVSALQQGRNASTSTTHGGFDDDGPTMGSVARRVLGKADADRIVEYVSGQNGMRGTDPWRNQVDWPEQLGIPLTGAFSPDTNQASNIYYASQPVASDNGRTAATAGRRRALCIGINSYPTAPLQGCVADAKAWAMLFKRLGFDEPTMLLDQQATRTAIISALERLVAGSQAGDVIVMQYSGHGTQVPDLDGDEAGGDSAGQDEALCPYDFATGAFLIDDDVGEIFNRLPDGVNLTCFIDCCHSGTITRFAAGLTPGAQDQRPDERPRFIQPTPELIEAHRRYRQRLGGRRAIRSGGPDRMREVVFSACLSSEVAWESRGQGEFTVRAVQVLQEGIQGMTNRELARRITAAFGATPRQHARLYCTAPTEQLPLLQAVVNASTTTNAGGNHTPGGRGDVTALVRGLQQLIQQFDHQS